MTPAERAARVARILEAADRDPVAVRARARLALIRGAELAETDPVAHRAHVLAHLRAEAAKLTAQEATAR